MTAESVFGELLGLSELGKEINLILGGKRGQDSSPAYRRAELSAELSNDFRRVAIDFVRDLLRRRESIVLGPYDAGYVPEDFEVRYIRIADSDEVRLFLDTIPEPEDADVFEDDDAMMKDLSFFLIKAKERQTRPILLFRTITPSKKLTMTKGIVAHLVGRRFEKLEDTSLVFEPGFQVVVFEGYLFIISQHGFETLFLFYKDLRENADTTLDQIEKLVPIANFQEFRSDAIQHLNKVRKLRNISRSAYLPSLSMARLKETIREFGLPIQTVTEDGREKLLYERADPWSILQLLEDQFVKSSTTGKKYAANSKREIAAPSPGRQPRRGPSARRRRRR